MYTIDNKTYNKLRRPIGSGYDLRPRGKHPSSIIIHSTNGNRGSSFDGECQFLYNSNAVSADYLTGKQGQIVQFLPSEYRSWHAGVTIEGYYNSDSLGIETHFTPGEAWSDKGTDALTWLVKKLMGDFSIPIVRVDTHRRVALPKGRKSDPSQFSDEQFYAWRATLDDAPVIDNPVVIGVEPKCTRDAWNRSLLRNNTPLLPNERERDYTRCVEYGIEPAFVISLMKHEGDFGRSELQRITNNPFNIKAEQGDDRPTQEWNGRQFLKFESYYQGLEYGLTHLKWIYGWQFKVHTVRDIITRFAPASDGNAPDSYIAHVLEDLKYIWEN